MPACLPPSLAAVATHPDTGVAALHGDEGEAVFPEAEAVGALVDLSGKKWAHTAVRVGAAWQASKQGQRRAGRGALGRSMLRQ